MWTASLTDGARLGVHSHSLFSPPRSPSLHMDILLADGMMAPDEASKRARVREAEAVGARALELLEHAPLDRNLPAVKEAVSQSRGVSGSREGGVT